MPCLARCAFAFRAQSVIFRAIYEKRRRSGWKMNEILIAFAS